MGLFVALAVVANDVVLKTGFVVVVGNGVFVVSAVRLIDLYINVVLCPKVGTRFIICVVIAMLLYYCCVQSFHCLI